MASTILSVLFVLMLVSSSICMRQHPPVKRTVSCSDLDHATDEFIISTLRQDPYEMEIITLSNKYLGSSLSIPIEDLNLVTGFYNLMKARELYSEVDLLVTDVITDIRDTITAFEESCRPMIHGKRSVV